MLRNCSSIIFQNRIEKTLYHIVVEKHCHKGTRQQEVEKRQYTLYASHAWNRSYLLYKQRSYVTYARKQENTLTKDL